MATPSQWVAGARPPTLPAAVAPVAVGTGAALALKNGGAVLGGAAAHGPRAHTAAVVLALIVALALQVGVNYANDYSDGVRGTDDRRVGPVRLTATRLAPAPTVKRAALLSFAVAALAGLALVALAGTWGLVLVGAAAIVSAWYYTGGSHPYGYAGLGELFVFVFFGLVAVLGTTYTQVGHVSWLALTGAVGVGANACALLVVNNLRDIPTDAATGKKTLAVRLGDRRTRLLYEALVLVALVTLGVMVALGHPRTALAALFLVPAARALRLIRGGAVGPDLLDALRDTGSSALIYGVLAGIGLGVHAS